MFQPSTRRWHNKATGAFVGQELLKEVRDSVLKRDTLRAFLASDEVIIPKNFREAIDSNSSDQWKDAMQDEMRSLIENEVFEVVDKSIVDKQPVKSRWVFTVKTKQDGQVDKFKARVVAKGYSQIFAVDCFETYCSVVQIMSTRSLQNHAARECLYIRQFDIRTAFLYGKLDEDIFMIPPDGYSGNGCIWKLKRSLYGLKQSPRMWFQRLNSFLTGSGLSSSRYDQSVCYQHNPRIYVIVYVDDGLIFARTENDINSVLAKLSSQFKLREFDPNTYRRLVIEERSDCIVVHQRKYIQLILKRFKMALSNPCQNPTISLDVEEQSEPLSDEIPFRQVVGSLVYLADSSRPDISFAVNQLARELSALSMSDWKRAKHVLRYLRGTVNLGLTYRRHPASVERKLIGFCDSDFAGSVETSKSTPVFIILLNGAPFHWKTQLQRHVTVSSTEAELIALCSPSKELAWIRRMAIELELVDSGASVILCDNMSAMRIA